MVRAFVVDNVWWFRHDAAHKAKVFRLVSYLYAAWKVGKMRKSLWIILTALLVAIVGAALPAMAGEIVDQITTSSGQLASFTNGPFTPDINIVSAGAEFGGVNFTFEANVAGPVGTNPGAAYVFGINTGTNLAGFAPFMIGEDNVRFDTAVILLGNGTGFVFDVLTNSVSAALPNGSVTINGETIDAVVPDSLIPSLGGFSPGQYQVDLWTRVGLNSADKTQLADFAPNNMDVPFETPVATPEPSSLMLMLLGVGLLFVMRKRIGQRLPQAS